MTSIVIMTTYSCVDTRRTIADDNLNARRVSASQRRVIDVTSVLLQDTDLATNQKRLLEVTNQKRYMAHVAQEAEIQQRGWVTGYQNGKNDGHAGPASNPSSSVSL